MEDYKKKYEEALERAKKLIALPDDKAMLEEIFPELKESEDESIKEDIISLVNEFWERIGSINPEYSSRSKMIAWLEKQGEHANFRNKIQIGDKVTRNEDGVLVNLSQLNRVAKPAEKQREQKPIDKVEPKFHEGDLVVNNCGYVWKIEGILNQFYLLEGVEGGESRPTIKWVNKTFHLWNIADAKDGDVLTTDTWTFIFKKYQDKFVYYHCAASTFNNFSISDTGEFDSNYVHPATKEQRYFLFKKMEEAGYEWDAEKKELKKIEQKPAWSEEDEKFFKTALWHISYSVSNGKRTDEHCDTTDWLKSVKERLKSMRPQSHKWYIKKGHWYMCIVDKPEYGWTKGKVYQSPEDNRIETDYKGDLTNWPDSEPWFRPATTNEIPNPQPHWKPSDLPHWKKSTLPNDNTTGFNSDYFCHKGYCINYKELFEKLPKDD